MGQYKSSVQEYEIIYNRYVDKVYQQCLLMTKDVQQAQDFTQDIFLKVFYKLDTFQQRSSISTWLYAIAYNYCAYQLRLAKRHPISSLESGLISQIADSETDLPHEEALQRLSQALGLLSEDERCLLLLKYEQGKSLEELTQLYNLGLSAIKMRLKRSREKIYRFYIQAS